MNGLTNYLFYRKPVASSSNEQNVFFENDGVNQADNEPVDITDATEDAFGGSEHRKASTDPSQKPSDRNDDDGAASTTTVTGSDDEDCSETSSSEQHPTEVAQTPHSAQGSDPIMSKTVDIPTRLPLIQIPGLFRCFSSAASHLRNARVLKQLDESAASSPSALSDFFITLDIIEEDALQHSRVTHHKIRTRPFVVVVEGLDGSGKSTLVQNLAQALNWTATGTPPSSLSSVRPVFDKAGGLLARAFYMVSNYVLQYQIRHSKSKGFVVDRWYSTTASYTIGYNKNTTGGPDAIDELPKHLFDWPHDLTDVPNLILLLDASDEVRKERVKSQPNKNLGCNLWNNQISSSPDLAARIMRAYQRINLNNPKSVGTVVVDASQSAVTVLRDAKELLRKCALRHHDPVTYFKNSSPLEFFKYTSSILGLCDFESGTRCKHAPWAFQIAMNGIAGTPPSLRTVGIHSVDAESGILFFTRGAPGGGAEHDVTSPLASMVWVGGDYPEEQQWRAEGILCTATLEECIVMMTEPPCTLVAQMTSSHLVEKKMAHKGILREKERQSMPTSYPELVAQVRDKNPLSQSELSRIVIPTRFVPFRMEVLIGGPSSPGGPKRYEWVRLSGLGKYMRRGEWTPPRMIMPYSRPSSMACPINLRSGILLPVTLVLTGTHCSGKRTLGTKLAEIMGWVFHLELGDVLRSINSLVADSHVKKGSGVGAVEQSEKDEWDEYIHKAECDRDNNWAQFGPGQSVPVSRVVETWHVGNLAWALQRKPDPNSTASEHHCQEQERVKILAQKARSGIQQVSKKSSILFVHLLISPETSVRRRDRYQENALRLPMSDQDAECSRLHEALEMKGLELLKEELCDLNVPLLILNNDEDGVDALMTSVRRIIDFVHHNHWRRATI